MGLQDTWNNNAFIEYFDRWWANDYNPDSITESHKYGADTKFTRNMWLLHRSSY